MTADLAEFWVRSRGCPHCGETIHAVLSLAPTHHWLCPGCGRCWMLVHGHLRRVDPLTCQGCATRAKVDCVACFGASFPAFTGGGIPHEAT